MPTKNTPGHAYERSLSERGYTADAAQTVAIGALDQCARQWAQYRKLRRSPLRRLLRPPSPPLGVYLYGGVGRGKSFLMDCFFSAAPVRRKTRLHFHEFMREVHRELAQIKGVQDPLDILAKRIAKKFQLICFDEFHISNIADAMILHRLLDALFARGVGFIMTSNFRPDQLYPGGMHRDRLLPAIALLQEKMQVLNVDAGVDYRQRTPLHTTLYHCPDDALAHERMERSFTELADAHEEKHPNLHIEGRNISVKRRAGGVLWMDFSTLCGGARSQNDYLEIASCYHTLILSGVPEMQVRNASEARRFTWLIDVLYDRRVKLILSAAVPPEQLYRTGPMVEEFARTVSRLNEMQAMEFLSLGHRQVDTALS